VQQARESLPTAAHHPPPLFHTLAMENQTPNPTPTLEELQQQIAALQQIISTLSLQTAPNPNPNTTPTPLTSLKICTPEPFDGTTSKADAFVSELALYFNGKGVQDDHSKVIFALSYMKGGTAGPWAKLKVKEFSQAGVTQDWNSFLEDFKASFGDPDPAGTARHKMDQLKQGAHTIEEYVASFREIADDTGYNDPALVEKFERGLNQSLVDKIYALPEMPKTLKDWIQWSTRLDRQWRQREARKKTFGISSNKPAASLQKTSNAFTPVTPPKPSQPFRQPDVVPMEVDSGWKMVKPKVCFRCKKPGHFARNCTSPVNIGSMDFDHLKAYIKEELQKEEVAEVRKEDF